MMVDVSKGPLPEAAYIPGKNTRPNPEFLEKICEQADPVTTDAGSTSNLPWVYGIRLFNGGFYWEAHEVWESVWMKAPPNSREKIFVQGMIHFANGLLKIRMGRPAAACRLFDLADECINDALAQHAKSHPEQFMGVRLARLRAALQGAKQSNDEECVDKFPFYEFVK